MARKRAISSPDDNESQPDPAPRKQTTKQRNRSKEVHQLQTKVANGRRELSSMLQERWREAERLDVDRRNNIASTITEALQSPANASIAEDAPAQYANTSIAMDPHWQPANELLQACGKLVTDYEKFESVLKATAQRARDENVVGAWQKDVDNTERLLRLGHKVALRKVNTMLGEAVEEDEKEPGVELDHGFVEALQYAERGVKRMVKGVPEDETEN